MEKPWYLLEYERRTFLHNLVLYRRQFICTDNEHDHCDLCWARFSNYQEDEHAGYFEPNSRIWICTKCFDQFAELFGWTDGNNQKQVGEHRHPEENDSPIDSK